MNIIYLNTHDSGRFLQPYGYGLPTPNLQKFAEKGTVFRQMYCAAPTCCPSRAAMLTGMNAHSSGVTGLVHRGFALKAPKQHLANYLKSFDFETVLAVFSTRQQGIRGKSGMRESMWIIPMINLILSILIRRVRQMQWLS